MLAHRAARACRVRSGEAAGVLPRLSFFEIASRTPAVILDSDIFYLILDPQAVEPAFLFEDLRFRLEPSGQSLWDVEQQYFELFAAPLDRFKTHFLQTVIDARIAPVEELRRKIAGNQILAFLVTELIPRLVELELGRAGFDRWQREHSAHFDIAQVLHELPPAPQPERLMLEDLIGRDAMILDGKVYPLVAIDPDPAEDLVLLARGEALGLGRNCHFLGELETAYMTRLYQVLEAQARVEAPERQRMLQLLDAEQAKLLNLPGVSVSAESGTLYRGRQHGVLQRKGVYYVYTEVPEFAVSDVNGWLYRFEATRVAVAVTSCNPEQLLAYGRAVVLEPYEHMFVDAKGVICMTPPSRYYADLHRLPLAEALCIFLEDARRTLLAGHYAGHSSRPFHRISDYTQRRISPEEAESRGLPIYGYFR